MVYEFRIFLPVRFQGKLGGEKIAGIELAWVESLWEAPLDVTGIARDPGAAVPENKVSHL